MGRSRIGILQNELRESAEADRLAKKFEYKKDQYFLS